MTANRRPILVTGVHRSGTTWVGKMLAAGGQAAYISEPLNVWHRRGVLNAEVPNWYFYLCKDNESHYLSAFGELMNYKYLWLREVFSLRSLHDLGRMGRDWSTFLLGKLLHRRPLLKDPFAVFSIPWFIERFDCQVVVTVRHPAAFASSLKRLNWPFDMRELLSQPYLMRDRLSAYEEQMRACLTEPQDILRQAAVLWSIVYETVLNFEKEGYPLAIVRHEDLSRDPLGEFEKLYRRLDLNYNARAKQLIRRSSSAENPKELRKNQQHSVRLDSRSNLTNWRKRLTEQEIERIQTLTEKVASSYYSAESWQG